MLVSVSLVWEVLASFIFWTTLYFTFCHVKSTHSQEWHCREVTFLHALTVIFLSGWCGFVQGPWPFTDPAGDNTPLQRVTMVVCLGYFIFDFIWCLYFQTEGPVMLLHHSFSIIGVSGVLVRGYGGTEVMAAIFGAEFTNPFLQMRWFLRSSGKHKTWYAEVNDILFMSLFGIMRLGIGSNLLYCYLNHPKPDKLTKFCAIMFYLIGVAFWVMIVKYAINKYKKMYGLGGSKGLQAPDKTANNNSSLLAKNSEDQDSGEMNGLISQSTNGNASHSKNKNE